MHIKRKKRHSIPQVIGVCILLSIIVYFSFVLVMTQISINNKEKELAAVNEKVNAQITENAELAQIVENDDEAAYMERIARDKLGYALPGERFFVDMSGE